MRSPTKPRAPEHHGTRDGHARPVAVNGSGRQGGHVIEMQRRRLLTATGEIVYERGVQAFNIALVCERAGVSRKTFYDIFADREACLLAGFEEAVAKAARAIEQAASREQRWRDMVRAGLTTLLSLFDQEPAIGRLLVVEALGAGEPTLNARRHVLAQIAALVDEGRREARQGRDVPPLTAEGTVGAVFSVIHARMLACPPHALGGPRTGEHSPQPLVELVGPLMAMIVQPYLGPAAARKELDRPLPASVSNRRARSPVGDPFKDLPIRLTYRTARVLCSIAVIPGASSKQVASAAGVSDEGQMSRLLARLERVGLVQNTGAGPAKGLANAWSLTERGQGVLQAVGQD